MSVVYFNDHSITFIKSDDGTAVTSYKRSWYDFHLIPARRPSIVTPRANLKLITIPGSNKCLDLTESMPGGLIFGRRQGQWEFYVDTSKWNSWAEAKNEIEDYLNGQYVYIVLEDDHSHCYVGRVSISNWTVDPDYPMVTIDYDLYYTVKTNNFQYIVVPTIVSISSTMVDNAPTFILGDPLNTVRPYIKTTATYDTGETTQVTVDSFGDGLIEHYPTETAMTSYKSQSSNVTFNVREGTAVELVGILKTGKNSHVWLGSNKSIVTDFYTIHKKYENGYVAKNYGTPVGVITGVFGALGNQSAMVSNGSISGNVEAFVKVVQSLIISRSIAPNVPSYMRVGEWTDRMLYYLKGTGTTNGGYTESYTYSDLEIASELFTRTGTNYIDVTASNKAEGYYKDYLTDTISITVNEGYTILTDDWNAIKNSINDGTYKTKYKVGDLALLQIPNIYNGYVQIVGIDKDYDENNNTIPITWILKEALEQTRPFNSTYTNSYLTSELRSYIDGIEASMPSVVRNMLVPAYKEIGYYESGRKFTTEFLKLWVPSGREVGDAYNNEHDASNIDIIYSSLFTNNTERIKFPNDISGNSHYTIPVQWHTRNIFWNDSSPEIVIKENGSRDYINESQSCSVIFGFCTGASE